MKTAIYLRVSTDDQAKTGYGLDVQEQKTRAMATVKGWSIVEPPFCDEGLSGTLPVEERPGLSRLMESAKAGRIDAVIVYALDRIGRKTKLVLDVIEQLAEYGVAIISCNEALDTSTPAGQFVLTMFAALGQLERDTIVERTTAGRNERGEQDGEKGGRVPFGYQRIFEKGKAVGVEIDVTAVRVVQRIFAERKAGATLTAIAERLNSDGIQTSRGYQWHASSVRQILLNEDAYRGGTRGDSAEHWPVILK